MRVSPEIESLVPYKPGKSIAETQREFGLSEIIKLASNENALGPSPKAVKALQESLHDLHRYPDPSCFELKKKIAERWQLQSNQIVIGNGSNEIIDLLVRVFCEPGDRVLMAEKSFVAYRVCSQAARVGSKQFAINEDWQMDVDQVIDHLENQTSSRDKIFFLANPNNPTGTYLKKSQVERIINVVSQREDMLFVFDEAYDEFVRATDIAKGLDYVRSHKNVMVSKTFSKVYGLAGLRLGALIGDPEHLQWLERVRNPFNVNTLAQAAAMAAIDDHEYLRQSQEMVWTGLDQYYEFFKEMGLPYWESQANFLLFDSLRDSHQVFSELLKKGLVLRPLHGYQMPTHLRISIGTEAENQKAMALMREVLPTIKVIK